MAQRRFPAGVQDFESIIKDGFVYVDKTEYIYNLTNNYGNAIFLSPESPQAVWQVVAVLNHEALFPGTQRVV